MPPMYIRASNDLLLRDNFTTISRQFLARARDATCSTLNSFRSEELIGAENLRFLFVTQFEVHLFIIDHRTR